MQDNIWIQATMLERFLIEISLNVKLVITIFQYNIHHIEKFIHA